MQVVRKQKRNKMLIALLLPLTIIIFLIGWSLSWIGTQKQPRKTPVKFHKENVYLKAIPLEEPKEIPN